MAYYKCGKIFATQNSNTSIETASGAIANFNTSLAMPVLGCIADFSASQASGTPTPVAPIPIVGVDKVNITRCGKNLFDKSALTTNHYIDTNGDLQSNNQWAVTDYMPISNTAMYYSGATRGFGTAPMTAFYRGDKSLISTWKATGNYGALTIPNGAKWVRMSIYGADADTFQLELGSTATDFEAYNGTTAPINLGGTYYGGSVDAVTGKITLTHGIVDLSTISWTYASDAKRWRAIKKDMKKYQSRSDDIIFEKYETDTSATIGSENKGYISGAYIYVHTTDDTAYPNGNACYPLATPIVVYASNTAEIPTKAGLNNIFCDTGDIEVKYRRIAQ